MSNGSQHAAYAIEEVTYAVTPTTPTMFAIRHTDFDLGMDKDTLQSAEIRADRNVSDLRLGQNKCGGSFGMEVLNDLGFENFMAAVFGNAWSTGTLVNGLTRKSFSILRHFGDLDSGNKPYHLLTGVEFGSCDLKIPTGGIATVSFDTIAKTYVPGATAPASSTLSAPTTTGPMDSFTGVVQEGGATIGVITEANVKFDNGLDRRFVIGSKDTLRPSQKKFTVSGSISCYYESATMLDKFLNGTDSSLSIQLANGAETFQLDLPKVKYTGGRVSVKDDGPIVISLPFTAVYDGTTAGSAKLTRNPTT